MIRSPHFTPIPHLELRPRGFQPPCHRASLPEPNDVHLIVFRYSRTETDRWDSSLLRCPLSQKDSDPAKWAAHCLCPYVYACIKLPVTGVVVQSARHRTPQVMSKCQCCFLKPTGGRTSMASRFNIYSDLVISRNELEISTIQLLISPIHLVISPIHLVISPIQLMISTIQLLISTIQRIVDIINWIVDIINWVRDIINWIADVINWLIN